jgi:hypothetical protein
MSLYITVSLSNTEKITGMFDPAQNRFAITAITNGKEIAEALQKYVAEPRNKPLPLELQSVGQTLANGGFTTESAPWLSYIRIASNSIEGWDTSKGTIALSVAVFGDYDKFWEGSFSRLTIGTGPYLL